MNLFETTPKCLKCGEEVTTSDYFDSKGFCKKCKPEILVYSIHNTLQGYHDICNMKLVDLECKHIMFKDEKSKQVIDDALGAFYSNIQWGFHRNATIESENEIIDKMVYDGFLRPIRITITDNHVWADNTHTTIAYTKMFGPEAAVIEVPFYICDVRGGYKVIGDVADIDTRHSSITGAITNSLRLNEIENHGGRTTSWVLQDLINQIIV